MIFTDVFPSTVRDVSAEMSDVKHDFYQSCAAVRSSLAIDTWSVDQLRSALSAVSFVEWSIRLGEFSDYDLVSLKAILFAVLEARLNDEKERDLCLKCGEPLPEFPSVPVI